MNVLSLFDGMSCGQIALDKLGIKVDNYFSSEIDNHTIQVTQKNYPKTNCKITKVGFKAFKNHFENLKEYQNLNLKQKS